MGSTGDSPVPVGDPPTGRSRQPLSKGPSLSSPGALVVPPGESPGGTGQRPVLPKNRLTAMSGDRTARGGFTHEIARLRTLRGEFPLPAGETSELVCKHILKKIFTHLFSRGSRQSGVKIAGTSFQTGDVFGVIIPSTVLPAAPHDPLPLEGQRTDRRMMTLAPLDLHPVVAQRPGTTHVDPERFAAGLLDRRNAAVSGHGLTVGKAISLGAPSHRQPRSQRW